MSARATTARPRGGRGRGARGPGQSGRRPARPFEDPAVAAVFRRYPPAIERKLQALRELVFETAAATEGVGRIEETLKWGQPAYLTPETKSGSTIRLGWKAAAPREYSLDFHCQTTLVAEFRKTWADRFVFDGNRRIVLDVGDRLPKAALARCIAAALTYHRRRRTGRS